MNKSKTVIKSISKYEIGYYGIPGSHRQADVTKVHVKKNGERTPVCGAHIRMEMSYQWCSTELRALHYVECIKCQQIGAKIMLIEKEQEAERMQIEITRLRRIRDRLERVKY